MSRATIVLFVALTIFFTNIFAEKLICDRKNEEYDCGSACQTTCCNLGQTCKIINITCNNACYCKKGYARRGGDDGPCIPIHECSHETCTSHDEKK
ncbi:PREDICTED: inducible metalloproteinase inhibitor protein-like [Dinoponera quadriceps]|uniref:Inducible metalloproteinase inhibitor protein-like n=1 Tax=Dinoponera quadriceps TaxID=609295 RepID=A0A6P3X581_DINQU|nr:PREDICTED: inducible metalloproteinase inhibitor protein-like [Dinoponera quadriceps]